MTGRAASAHRADRRLRSDQQRQHVDLEHLAPPLGVTLDDRTWELEPRVVHHDVEPAGRFHRLVDQALHLLDVARIERDRSRASAGLLDGLYPFLERRLAASGQEYMRACLAEPNRNCAADSARRAGDDRGASFKRLIV